MEQTTARYEERITELHSVIAELRKKIERHQINVIRLVGPCKSFYRYLMNYYHVSFKGIIF